MKTIKNLYKYIKDIKGPPLAILKAGIGLSCLLLFITVCVLIEASQPDADLYNLLHIAAELQTLPQAVLLLTVILSAVAHDLFPEK